jgi:CheY-like chemotaxis protein
MPKVLYVEDNEMNRDALSRLLKRKGYEIVLAVDGAEGVSMAHSEAPSLILMDISLPVLDGYAATREIKGDPATASIPIIGLSAHAMTGDAEKALEAGCDDYDTKPVDMPRLLGKMQALLEKASSAVAD